MQTIQDRGYVWKKGQALVPTTDAFAVVSLLEQHFSAPRGLRVHGPDGGRPRRDRRWPSAASPVAPQVLVRQRRPRSARHEGEGPRGGRRRGHQHDPARRRRARRADRGPQRSLRPVPQAGRGHRLDPRGPAASTSSPSIGPSRSCSAPEGRRAARRPIPRPGCRSTPRAVASAPTCSSATPTRCRRTPSRRCRRCSRRCRSRRSRSRTRCSCSPCPGSSGSTPRAARSWPATGSSART